MFNFRSFILVFILATYISNNCEAQPRQLIKQPTLDYQIRPRSSLLPPATAAPKLIPSATSTAIPSYGTSVRPSSKPTVAPSVTPTVRPSLTPTASPSVTPTINPSSSPSVLPTASATVVPTSLPSPGESFTCNSTFCPNNGQGICYETETTVSGEYKGKSNKSYLSALALGAEVPAKEVECTFWENIEAGFLLNGANCVYDSAIKKLEDEIAEIRKKIAVEQAKYPQTPRIRSEIDSLNQKIQTLQKLINEHKDEIQKKKNLFMQRCTDGFTTDCRKSNRHITEEKLKETAQKFCESEYNKSHDWQCRCQDLEDDCFDQNCQCRSSCFNNTKPGEPARQKCLDKCDSDEEACKNENKECSVKYCVKYKDLKKRGTLSCIFGTF